jgi:hypothetical protein
MRHNYKPIIKEDQLTLFERAIPYCAEIPKNKIPHSKLRGIRPERE